MPYVQAWVLDIYSLVFFLVLSIGSWFLTGGTKKFEIKIFNRKSSDIRFGFYPFQ
jgi:hypothetical protein